MAQVVHALFQFLEYNMVGLPNGISTLVCSGEETPIGSGERGHWGATDEILLREQRFSTISGSRAGVPRSLPQEF